MFKSSGKVIIFIACKERSKHTDISNESNIETWKQLTFKVVTDSKPNIVTKKNQHFQSTGNIYSFGNKAFYGLNESLSSVSQYVTKKSINPNKQEIINEKASICEKLCCSQVEKPVHLMKKLLPRIDKLISPL